MGLWISAPILLSIATAGLVTSILQALTQIQDQTVGFVVKVAITLLYLWLLGPWMLHRLSDNLQSVLLALAP